MAPLPAAGQAPAEPDPPPRPSRRVLLAGGLTVAALAATGGSVALSLARGGGGHRPPPPSPSLRARHSGRLLPDLLRARPFYVAHRGGDADWPEMSLEAYRQSVALGVDALEVSLARSRDGVWFGLHDDTLDRTSGTTGFVASRHSWAEISRYRIGAHGTRDPGQEPRPYLRFEELVAAYASTHTVFVDPKAAATRYHPELLRIMAAVPAPGDHFVAKSSCTAVAWARAAHAQGLRTWGYYYGRDVEAGRTPPAATQAEWDLLGLDVAASPAAWSLLRSFGKVVIAHVVADAASARQAIARGAGGLMVSDPLAVLGPATAPSS